MKILVTGFDPFGGEKINPALETIKLLPKDVLGANIITREIPTVIGKSLAAIQKAVEKENPDVVLSIGQAGGRADISVERIGINIDDYRLPDNEGNPPIDEPVIPGGPDAYFVTIPIKAIVEKIRAYNIPASISNTAGTFICNHVCYGGKNRSRKADEKRFYPHSVLAGTGDRETGVYPLDEHRNNCTRHYRSARSYC